MNRPIRPCGASLLILSCSALVLAGPAGAVPLPASGAYAEATAGAPGATPAPDTDSAAGTMAQVSAAVTASGSDTAAAEAGVTSGALRGRSAVEGASGAQGPSEATTVAHWTVGVQAIQRFGVSGTVDVDLRLDLDGSLDYFQNNANPGLDDVLAEVGARLVVHDAVGARARPRDRSAPDAGGGRRGSFQEPRPGRSGDRLTPATTNGVHG